MISPSNRRNSLATREQQIAELQEDWDTNPRWMGVTRAYTAAEVVGLRGSLRIEHTLAQRGADKLWRLLNEEPFVNALGALTGVQAMQQVKAGLKAIYLPGWQVAGETVTSRVPGGRWWYSASTTPCSAPTRSSGPKATGHRLLRAHRGRCGSGFGGVLNAFELMKMIEAGAAGVHSKTSWPRQEVRPMGGKVLVPTREAVEKLTAARMAADVMGVPTLLIARTDAEAADLLTSDVDDNDQPFCTGERTVEGSTGAQRSGAGDRARWPMRRTPTWSGAKPPSRTWPSPALRRSGARQVSGQDAGLQLLAVVQLEEEPGRRHHRRSRPSWARWATSSSSSRWPASTR
jgi:isocitrate lyase